MTQSDTPQHTNPRGLTYRGDVGTVSVYDFWLRGRVVLEVAVDTADPELTISVGKPGASEADDFQPTRGRARWSFTLLSSEQLTDDDLTDDENEQEQADTGPRMLDSYSIRHYVQPRLAVLIARVFVPGDIYAL
jgi:hypothetical protein